MAMGGGTQILEINLISAQNLKTPPASVRRTQTYALVYIDPSVKLRTVPDRLGGENPTWNEKFIFRVSPEFISSDTSGVSVEIFSVGCIRDYLIGTVRFLLSSCLSKTTKIGTPAFSAVHIRRPSGRCHGVLNVAATIFDGSEFALLSGLNAISFRDLIGEGEKNRRRARRLSRGGSKRSEQSSGGESCDLDSVDYSDGTESTTSSSSNTSTVLKECNRELAGNNKDLKSDGLGLLCGLMLQKRVNWCPSDRDIAIFEEFKENKH